MFVEGKSSIFLKLKKKHGAPLSCKNLFSKFFFLHTNIAKTGNKSIPLLYDCKTLGSKGKLRPHMLVGMLTTSKLFVHLHFPQTYSSTKYHGLQIAHCPNK